MDAVLNDWTTADIPERTRAALRLLECMTLHPQDLDDAFIDGLKQDGLDDPAIREAANVGFHYNLINRVADAVDFPVPEGISTARLASILNMTGKRLKGSFAETVWVKTADGHIRPTEVDTGWNHMLTVVGKTDPELRRNVGAFVGAQWQSGNGDVPSIPDELDTYLKKLALHAYRITDEDVEALKDAGYSDEMLYELTIVGATGSALVGLENLFETMYG